MPDIWILIPAPLALNELTTKYGNVTKKSNELINKVKEANIEVTGYETPETGRNRYVAEFEYNKVYYCLSGEMKKEEMENILKNLYFLVNYK